MDDFAADHAYDRSGDRFIVADDDATFTDFAASPETVFTRGDADTIRFAERPMWLRVDTSGEDAVAIEAHDTTNTGQPIRVDASWLASHGVPGEPLASYHDGTTIPVEPTADGTAYVVDAPHFSHITLQLVDFDTSWKQEGHTREMFADGPAGSGTFNITVSAVTDGTIEFRFWSVQNGSENVFDGDETFQKVDRESLDRSGYHTYNFVNETNLATGYAMLGDDQYHLETVNRNLGTYDFSAGNLTYRFDQTTGFLVEVEDAGNGATITMQDVRSEEVPASDQTSAYSVYLTQQTDGMEVNSEYDDFEDPVYDNAFVKAWWDDGDPDGRTTGNILSGQSEVDVKAHYDMQSIVDTYKPSSSNKDCFERDACHVNALMTEETGAINFHVHFSGNSWESSQSKMTYCSAPDCDWDVALGYYVWIKEGTFTLTGTYEHGLLGSTSEPFWLCGHGRVWDTTDVTQEPVWREINCRSDLEPDSSKVSNPSGYVTVTTDPSDIL